MEGFAVVELKKESRLSWEVELSWEDVFLGCNNLPQLSLTEQVEYLRLTSVAKKYDVERCMFTSNLRDIKDAASRADMDNIKAPKNFTLSRESMNAALDALRAGRYVSEATQEVAQVISSRSASRFVLPAPASSRAPKPSSRGVRSSRPSSRSRPSSAPQSSQAPRSQWAPTEGAKKAPGVTARPVEGTELVRKNSALPSGDVPEERFKTSTTEERAPEGGMEVAPVTEGVKPRPVDDEGATERVGSKRPPPSEAPASAPISKRSRASRRPGPALPPLEKKKETSVVPLLFAPDNDILNAEDITHQSPASVVAEILRERMFGGVTEASNPRLLALTSLLVSSTREQVAFRSRTREELGGTIREMLLMLMGFFMEVDARDESIQSTVDRQIEEARLEENLIATSDARGHLAAAQEHLKTLREELAHTKEALEGADKRVAAAEVRLDEVLEQLSSLEETQKERDEAWHQHESLKADFDVVLAQKDEALARVVVLEQELSKRADNEKDLALAVEASRLQNQHLCQEVEALKKRCSALLEDAKHAEDRVQLECEERLWEYKESAELKREIEQACEACLQGYKDSSELKAGIAEACEERLAEYKASDEIKNAIWQKGFRMFVSGFNRGLREARYAPSTPLVELRAAEEDSDGEEVLYGEDDKPLPKGVPHTATGSHKEDAELGEEGEEGNSQSTVADAKLQEEDAGPKEEKLFLS
ncbi:uncharacterized protein LOC110629302 [Manihot esculenta]|uniref:uncharacterized protein LOC110629302 n=1 Tax=Manihot esculenta TaxID=3983 RepID=UPI000B5D3277|nr:uncharacterized protein LOC110629302 [Manihot esculenta]